MPMPLNIEQMPIVRVFFSKTGRAKYTSHLDTMRLMTRALRRSGLPCWYTQGFNPHLYMTFSLPIALGYESLCESVDLRLTEEVSFEMIVARLNQALPPGFEAIMAAKPVMDASAIAWSDYDVRLVYAENDLGTRREQLDAFLRQPAIEVLKKTKKGEKTVDIKPMSQMLEIRAEGDAMHLKLRMASGISLNINPTLLLKAFYDWCGAPPDGVKILRTAILDKDFKAFA